MRIFIALVCLIVLCSCSKYKVTNATQNTSSYTLFLTYTGNDTYYVKPTSPIIKQLTFTINCLTNNDLTFKITDRNNSRYQVPQSGIFPIDPAGTFSFPINNSNFAFNYTADPFDFAIWRRYDNTVIFDSFKGDIIFSEHYMEISTPVSSKVAYGFGERFTDRWAIHPGKYTIFNRDRGQIFDKADGQQTYGFYPAYLIRESAGNFHFAYFRSTNAMDIVVQNDSYFTYLFTYKVIGGVLDFRFFLGDKNVEATIEKFQAYSGRSAIPPFWSLGFHQCRYGYKNVTYLQNVIANYEKYNIPLDTIWTDIDYMVDYEDFTIDETRFPLDRMAKITDKYRYVPIIDAGIKNSGSAYDEGLRQNVFLRDADGEIYTGKVWPGSTAFVDFFTPNATSYWMSMLDRLYSKVKFSGVWLDMNELANFCNGPCNPSARGNKTVIFDYSKDLPYQPGSDGVQAHTISLNATHYGNISQANLHTYFSFLQAYSTNQFLKSKDLRPFVITRASTLGSNKFTFHWTGDNHATWKFLKFSMSNNFMFQFWGIHMVGADICGFGGDTTEELCARWFQLGSFYTFARDHNDLTAKSQEPYALGPVVMAAAKTNLRLRYALLKNIYTNFIRKKGYGTIFRPVFVEFSNDIRTFTQMQAETQFMIGSQLLFAPIVTPSVVYRAVYLPANSTWYDYFSGKYYVGNDFYAVQNQITDPIPLFLRQGYGVFYQQVQNVTKTTQLNSDFILKAGLKLVSSSTPRKYQAVLNILSINDYHKESDIAQCITDSCEYSVTATMAIDGQGDRTLELNTTYNGGKGLNQPINIVGVDMFWEGAMKLYQLFKTPVVINGTGRVVVPLDSGARQLKTE